MTASKRFRVFATCDIGQEALDLLRRRGYEVEVYPHPEPPPKSLIVEKVRSGIDGLITTLRDPIDREVLEAGRGTLKVVAQCAVGIRVAALVRRTREGEVRVAGMVHEGERIVARGSFLLKSELLKGAIQE